MKRYKWMLCLLVLCIIAGQLTACKKVNKTEKETVAMGRYVEESVNLPEAVESGEEVGYFITLNPDEKLELLTVNKKDFKQNRYLMQSDGTWEQSMPQWLSKMEQPITGLCYDPDANCYSYMNVRGEDSEKTQVKILKFTDGMVVETVNIEDYQDAVDPYEALLQVAAISDNTIITMDYNSVNIYEDGKMIAEVDTNNYCFTCTKERLIVTDRDSDCIDFLNLSNGQIENQIEVTNLRALEPRYACDQEDNVYVVIRDGVYRIGKDGSKLEQIMDAKQNSLNLVSLGIDSIITVDQDNFYILYSDDLGERVLKHYRYDESLPTVPQNKLTVVSLYECNSVRQGIHSFETMYPDTWVDYQVLVDEESGALTKDIINTLNTELLAGNGPDILVLDGLPIDAYVEKGILRDLTQTLKPLLDEDKLLTNVVVNSTVDQGIYTVPLRIELSYAYGTKDAVNAVDTIESLAQYAKTQEVPIFLDNFMTSELFANLMYEFYSYEFIQDNSIDVSKLNDFLTNIKIIAEQIHTISNVEDSYINSSNINILNDILCNSIYYQEGQLAVTTLNDMVYSFHPIYVTDHINGSYSTIHNQYKPNGMVGINAKSTQSELASHFIEVLLSNEVQKATLEDGFPINTESLVGYELKEDDYCIDTGNYIVNQPEDKKKLQNILDLCTMVNSPIIIDEYIKDMVVEGAIKYLNGELSQQEAADSIMSKVNIYLQE